MAWKWDNKSCLDIDVVYTDGGCRAAVNVQANKTALGQTYRLLLSGHVVSCTVATGVRMNTKGLSGWPSSLDL